MNHLVYLDPQAGELEKILSGFKSMLVREIDTAQPTIHLIRPGDSLYFLRDSDENILRVKATVVRVIPFINCLDEDFPRTLKELQPRLQLTKNQYIYWSIKKQVLLVEFDSTQKIDVIHLAPGKVIDKTDWIAFEDLRSIT